MLENIVRAAQQHIGPILKEAQMDFKKNFDFFKTSIAGNEENKNLFIKKYGVDTYDQMQDEKTVASNTMLQGILSNVMTGTGGDVGNLLSFLQK